jgi:hypothetical protein
MYFITCQELSANGRRESMVTSKFVHVQRRGRVVDLERVTYYVAHDTVVPREDDKGLPRWVGGGAFCSDAAQLRACQRLLQAAALLRRRDRPGNLGLGSHWHRGYISAVGGKAATLLVHSHGSV